jgi:hypothetical protein
MRYVKHKTVTPRGILPKIKTIDVDALEWFDKVNGNSYFAGTVTVNYGMKTEKSFVMPFQYGYGDAYLYEAFSVLSGAGLIPPEYSTRQCLDHGIILRNNIKTGCLKRELKNITA